MQNSNDPHGCFSVSSCDSKSMGTEILDGEGLGDDTLRLSEEPALQFPLYFLHLPKLKVEIEKV